MYNFNFERRTFKGRPNINVRIPEGNGGNCYKSPEPPFLVSVIEKEIWIVESVDDDSFVCREPSVSEMERIREYIENPYIENNYIQPLGEI